MIFFLISLSTYICFLFLKGKLGLNKIKNKEYIKWANKTNKIELVNIILIIIIFNTNIKIEGICFIIFYMFLSLWYIFKYEKTSLKMLPLIIVYLLLYLIVLLVIIIQYDFYYIRYYYLLLIVLSYLSYYILYLLYKIKKLKIFNRK